MKYYNIIVWWWLQCSGAAMFYNSGSQPVARGPKVARQASKSGPRPPKEF